MSDKLFRVLIVEDDPIAETIAAELLKHFHCTIDTAENPQQALEQVNSYYYDLIFMDIGLDGLDGFEVSERIRNNTDKNSSTPIVALTRYEGEDIEKRCHELSMNGYLVKPMTFEKCRKVLDKFLAGEFWLT